jgi:glycosyltransferase involved in cell wall biosynthesis
MPHLLSINSYHYRRGGADAVYLDHAALMESFGWRNTFFSMRFPLNLPCESSNYFVDEIQFGHDYSFLQKVTKASKVVYSFEAQRKLRMLIQDRQPDIAHLHNIYHHLSPSILPVLKEFGIPVVMTAHDLKIACPNNKMLNAGGICERCKGGRYHQVVLHRCVLDSTAASTIVAIESALHRWLDSYRRNLDRIVVPSRFFIDKFVEWGWPRELFVHVPNFVDATAYQPAFEPGSYIVYFGRIAREKGLFTLVQAAARARVPLVLVGTGPIEDEVKRLAQRLGADATFAGYKTGAELRAIVRGARASVLPSEWYENSPISVLESLALGKPVIGARIGGIPEMVRDHETGWLFDSGDIDALATSLRAAHDSQDALLAEIGKQGRRLVESEFSRERYATSMLDIYAKLGVSASRIERSLIPDHA